MLFIKLNVTAITRACYRNSLSFWNWLQKFTEFLELVTEIHRVFMFVILIEWGRKMIWAVTWQNQQNECAPSEDSDQPEHPPSLIRGFAVHLKKHWYLSYPLSAQWRLWSDWAVAQADLSLRWAHTHFVGFVVSWLIFLISLLSSTCIFTKRTSEKYKFYSWNIYAIECSCTLLKEPKDEMGLPDIYFTFNKV